MALSGLTAIHQCMQAPGPGDPRRRIASAGVPVMRVVTLSEYLRVDERADSDIAPDMFRHYEVAGAAHATPDELTFAAAPADIVKAGVAVRVVVAWSALLAAGAAAIRAGHAAGLPSRRSPECSRGK